MTNIMIFPGCHTRFVRYWYSYDTDRREGIWPGDAAQKGHLSESSSIEAATWGINQTLRVHSELKRL